MKVFKKILALLPTFLVALLLAFFVWFSAVNSKDPTEEITYSRPIPIEVLGQNPQYTIIEQSASNMTVTLKAPRSVHSALANDMKLIRATINISALQEGQAEMVPEIEIDIKPVKLVDFNPKTVRFNIEKLVTQSFEIRLNQTGNLPMGLEARQASMDAVITQITGSQSKVAKVAEVIATVDMSIVTSDVEKMVELKVVDAQGNVVDGVTLSPSRVTIDIPILQKGGYKNAYLMLIPLGSPAYGFQITNTEITPQLVTIYASNPNLATTLPDLIETQPLNLNGRDASFEEAIKLNLPLGVQLVGDVEVIVKVTIEPIVTTKTVRSVPITLTNVPEGFEAKLNILYADVYLTGPTHLLTPLNSQTLMMALDLSELEPGTHQLRPAIVLPDESINYIIIPEMVEVLIEPGSD